jgi:hypothetical protein
VVGREILGRVKRLGRILFDFTKEISVKETQRFRDDMNKSDLLHSRSRGLIGIGMHPGFHTRMMTHEFLPSPITEPPYIADAITLSQSSSLQRTGVFVPQTRHAFRESLLQLKILNSVMRPQKTGG